MRLEEVADRAGISCEWYVKLEQRREVSASGETIAALAKGLMLDEDEAAHLRRLAAHETTPCFVGETAPESIGIIVRGLPEPAYSLPVALGRARLFGKQSGSVSGCGPSPSAQAGNETAAAAKAFPRADCWAGSSVRGSRELPESFSWGS